jgi:predicted PurR-regulated permease PerM
LVTLVAVAVVYGSVWVFGSTSGFLLTLVLAAFISFALLPAVEVLANRGWRRGAATGVVMIGGGLIGLVFVVAMIQVAVGEVIKLIDQIPEYVETSAGWLNNRFGLEIATDSLVEKITADQRTLENLAGNAVSGILGFANTALGLLFQALTISLFVFYILADLPRLRGAILRRVPPAQQHHIDTVTSITIEKVGGYVYSRLLLAGASAIFHFIVFSLIGLPYALALSLWVGLVSQFIPTVGTYLAGALPVLIALLEDPIDALWVVIAIAVYQQIENYALAPRVTANTMKLHPAVAFGAVIVGGSLLGGVGALLAIPAAATIKALVQTYFDHYEIVASGKFEDPDAYDARMHAKAEEKASRRAASRRKRTNTQDTESTGDG